MQQLYQHQHHQQLLKEKEQKELQLHASPLVEMGFFDWKFREAFKAHLISVGAAKQAHWMDLIIAILLFFSSPSYDL